MDWFNDFSISLISIILEGAPFLLLGSLISGVVDAWLPANAFQKWLPKKPTTAIFVSGLVPLLLPMCECGVVPVMRRLMQKGLPPACAVTYMLAAPIVNPIVALSTYAAFSGSSFLSPGASRIYDGAPPEAVVALRLILGFGIAVLAGLVALQFDPKTYLRSSALATPLPSRTGLIKLPSPGAKQYPEWVIKLSQAIHVAASDFRDIAVFLVMGAAVASFFNTAVDQEVIQPLASEPLWAIPAMLAFAFIIGLCSTSDAFIAATFVTFPLSSRLGFMVLGPMTDIKLIFIYRLVFRSRAIALFSIVLFFLVWFICYRLDPILAKPTF
ncbi:MAG: permease [Verrucomicrobiales bacterium]